PDDYNVRVGDVVIVEGFTDPMEVVDNSDPSLLKVKHPNPYATQPLLVGRSNVISLVSQAPMIEQASVETVPETTETIPTPPPEAQEQVQEQTTEPRTVELNTSKQPQEMTTKELVS